MIPNIHSSNLIQKPKTYQSTFKTKYKIKLEKG